MDGSGAKLAPHRNFETMSHLVDCALVGEEGGGEISFHRRFIFRIIRGIKN